MRNASIGSMLPLSAFAQQRERRRRQCPLGGELGTKCFQLRRRRQRAVPQQPRRLLEARVRRELADRVAGDDQLAALTIDIAQPRRRGNDALEPAVDHVSNVALVYDCVNID